MKQYLYLLLLSAFFASCSKLDQLPQHEATKDAIFNNKEGVEVYANSFYDMLPFGVDISQGDDMCDYFARNSAPNFIVPGSFDSRASSGWTWTNLRNINYFLEGLNTSSLDEAILNHYRGLARFFRAWFYFEKLKRFGDVPWINKTIPLNDPELFNGRDSRVLIVDSIIQDLDYAAQNITTTDATRSLITKYVAYGFLSRVCLFEGTFRKYHTEYKLTNTVKDLLTKCADAATEVIQNGGFSIFNGSGTDKSYRQLFSDPKPVSQEVMLAAVVDPALGVFHDANWRLTSATYGSRLNFIRTFINTYLNIDGTPFTNNPAYKTMTFMQETKNRDLRLRQTIRTPGYARLISGKLTQTAPVFSYTYTGYQPIKFTLDDDRLDGGTLNTNSLPLIRYAEILLNYAEAKAELGILQPEDWDMTIGTLRRRAGITGPALDVPATADPYLLTNYFNASSLPPESKITDPKLTEIRRERGIELAMEGFRFYDLVRWKLGKLMEMTWNGFYVAALDTPMNLNEDADSTGKPIYDVRFYINKPAASIPGVTDVNIASTTSSGINPQQLSEGTKGELTWLKNITRKFEDKNYLYPIPEADLQQNPKLGQNPGWDN